MIAITLLSLMSTLAQGRYIHNLDDQAHLSVITESGITLSQINPYAYLKISSNNGSTGYSWILDRQSCFNVVEIDAQYVYSPPENEFVGASGEERYTLTA